MADNKAIRRDAMLSILDMRGILSYNFAKRVRLRRQNEVAIITGRKSANLLANRLSPHGI